MDPYTKEAIEIGSEIAGGIIKSAFEGVTGWFKDKNKERDFFGVATQRYAKNLIERFLLECLYTDCLVSSNLRQRLLGELLMVPKEYQ